MKLFNYRPTFILTDDGKLQNKITDPKHKLEKTYLAQVEGEVSQDAIK